MWLCNPKGFSVFIPLQPGNISIELPTLLICISLMSAPGLGFCCVPSPLEHLLPRHSGFPELVPTMLEAFGPQAGHGPAGPSIPPSPRALSRGSPGAGWRAREIVLWLHQGVPGSRLSRGRWELVHLWGFPSCSQCPAFSSPSPSGFSHGSLPRAKP